MKEFRQNKCIRHTPQSCKNKKASRFDWRRFYSITPLYTSGLRRLCFIFANSKCFIAEQSGLPRRNEMKTGAASSAFALASYAVTSLKRLIYEARLAAYETKPFQASFFLPLKKGKKMVEHIYANNNLFSVCVTL